jgi:hypothetical protein
VKIGGQSFPSGYTIYCDDIREEVNNKTTFVGTYPNQMIVFGQAPALLAQLCAFIVLWLEPNDIPEKLTAKLIFVGESGQEHLLWEESVSPPKFKSEDLSDTGQDSFPHFEWRVVAQIFGVHLSEDGYIKSRVYYDDTEVRLGVLSVNFEAA